MGVCKFLKFLNFVSYILSRMNMYVKDKTSLRKALFLRKGVNSADLFYRSLFLCYVPTEFKKLVMTNEEKE